uniref:DUF382 domain-containing protein n=1 Tax=Populus davidiana TaxID=266767 RepID=A0A6M2EY29_9ROSI
MTVETLPYQNGVVSNGDLASTNPNSTKKSKESERRRRRRKQKKNKPQAPDASAAAAADGDDSDAANGDGGDAKENADPQQVMEQVVIEYVPEKAELENGMDEFRNVFEKFNFLQSAGSEENDKKDESIQNADAKKKTDSDSEEEEEDNEQKEKGVSNKKKKLQRRMKIADLKQICSRPDVVEVWDATSADPKLLVFLKSYRNTVPVPRHWCQKRKFLQGSGCDNHGAQTCMCLANRTFK